ncbi:MAG: hypothetical protein AB1Z29_16480 [Desulfobacterales bacterium]
MMSSQKITLGLSVHRPEMIPLIADRMRRHDAIFLEEPPADGFEPMLAGALAVDDYLRPLDVEYPAFSRDMCYLLRKLQAKGKKIFQVEPFLEILLGIHEFFADGHGPAELNKNSVQYPVYLAERNATKALLEYYQTAMTGSFEVTIGAVKQFARMDAARFRLRDSLRAQELNLNVGKYSSSYIEAGLIHYPLWRLLRKQMLQPEKVQIMHLADEALKTMGDKGHLYGPGDQLTLLYVFHPNLSTTRRETVLAARSIIFSKISEKEELTDDLNRFPHLRDELACIRTTRQLDLDDCRRIFPLVRRAKSSDARQLVARYLAESATTSRT